MTEFPIKKLKDSFASGTQKATSLGRGVLVSVIAPSSKPINPTYLFSRDENRTELKLFWSQPANNFWIGGIGTAYQVSDNQTNDMSKIRENYQSIMKDALVMDLDIPGTGPLMFGGIKFDPEAIPDKLWDEFPNTFFCIPNILITNHLGKNWITVNAVLEPQSSPVNLLAKTMDLIKDLWSSPSSPKPENTGQVESGTKPNITKNEWAKRVNFALASIEKDSLEKVVLARTKVFNLNQGFTIQKALNELCSLNEESTIFGISMGNSTFFGATPETLLKIDNGSLTSTCLAGSIKRGKTDSVDESLSQQLLSSSKDQFEHKAVVRELSKVFMESCDQISWDETPSILKLPNVQHLATTFSGVMKRGVGILQLLNRLHPTPAVGGVPKKIALEFIRKSEGDRGWYASPIGWVDANDNGEFVIAIRSGLIQNSQATLFAGCGIVKGSKAESEWAETELKFKPLLTALTGATT